MAKSRVNADRIRLTLDLSSPVNQHLEKLANESGKTKSELMRQAIDFLLRAQEAKEERMNVGAWKDEDGLRTERLFL